MSYEKNYSDGFEAGQTFAKEPSWRLINQLEREIIYLNEEVAGWLREHNMYRNAWCREIGGYIRPKAHEIDGFVLRTQDALKEAYQRGKQDARNDWTGRDKWVEEVGKALCVPEEPASPPMGTCKLLSKPHPQNCCGTAWRPL